MKEFVMNMSCHVMKNLHVLIIYFHLLTHSKPIIYGHYHTVIYCDYSVIFLFL